jgi:hypothetical protein
MATSSKQKLAYQKAYDATPGQKKKRAANNAARREAMRQGKVHKGDGKDVAHVVALKHGGSNAPSNLKVQDESTNRGWRKGKSSYEP